MQHSLTKQFRTPKDTECFFFPLSLEEAVEDFSLPVTSQLQCPATDDFQQQYMHLYSILNSADQMVLM